MAGKTEIVQVGGVRRMLSADPSEGRSKPRDIKTILLLSGPSHNLFGTRKPEQYGSTTLPEIEQMVTDLGKELGVEVLCAQTNSEGAAIDMLHYAASLGGVIMNPGAWCHYSYALHDAVESIPVPVIEIHISNIYARESFRFSVTARVSSGYIAGCGIFGYEMALSRRLAGPNVVNGNNKLVNGIIDH